MKTKEKIVILGIETSCDETGIALLEKEGHDIKILANVVASQVKLHEKYGGVFPALAKREHQRNLVPVLKQALSGAELLKILKPKSPARNATQSVAGGQIPNKIQNPKSKILKEILERDQEFLETTKEFLQDHQKPKIDAIAVTVGPGLEPCLWQGINFASALGFWWDLPIIPINHLEGHLFANFIGENFQFRIFNFQKFPVVALIVSGGHTQLILMRGFDQYKIIGETRDDAAGECFDKTARILGLGYPGGPAIGMAAAQAKDTDLAKYEQLKLPRPMLYSQDYDFSFSGLKTAVLYDFKKRSPRTKKSTSYIRAMSAKIQQAIIDVLIKKTLKAAKNFKVQTIILGGGVAANKELRQQLSIKIGKQLPHATFHIPPTGFCTDNAAMIALAGFYHLGRTAKWQKLKADGNLRV